MRLLPDRTGAPLTGLSLSQLLAAQRAKAPQAARRKVARVRLARRRKARIAMIMGVLAFALSLGLMAGGVARAAIGA